jgi:hypothetical protein
MLFSHRIADYAANPVTSGGAGSGIVATSNGTTSTYTAGGLTYLLHTFTPGSGRTFTVTQAGEIDFLLVGAGGANGNGAGGGGVYESLNYSISTGTYSLSVGAVKDRFSASENTTGFGTTAYAGGHGPFGGGGSAFKNSNTGATGGGGGGGISSTSPGTGKHSGGQSGNGPNPAFTAIGGGGGAGGAGGNGTYNGLGGNGGDGQASDITGSTQYYGAGQAGGGYTGYGTSPAGIGNPGSGGYDGTIIIRYQIA